MCGIAGVVSFDNVVEVAALNKMLKKLVHRGPDGEGKWSDKHVALGMRRLSIIDLEGGMQPLFNEDKSIVIIGNGEIYNYKQLNTLIKSKGHKPRTGSDIETIIHLYEEYGIDCVKKLTGMFAFALYDIHKKKFYIARDRLGEKPLYYGEKNGKFYFSSEFKSISQAIQTSQKNLNFDAINLYFHYYYVPEPQTIVKNIAKLPAGHTLMIDLKNGKKIMSKYWNPSDYLPVKYSNPTKTFRDALTKAVSSSLVSDVEVGVSLSGGLDSTAITALAAKKYQGKIKGFTVGYEGCPASDERALAAEVVNKYNLDHVQVEIKTEDVVNHFPQLVYDCDDPIADIAGHGIYSVSKLASRNGIKVLLGGLGGDELFWGYEWTRKATINNYISGGYKNLYNLITPYKSAELFISKLTTPTFRRSINSTLLDSIYKPGKKLISKLDFGRHTQDKLREIWLVSNCIALTDRLSMAANVELRSPLLNHQLVETAYKSVRNTNAYLLKEGKYWYKKSIVDLIPEKVLNAPKRGFTPPVSVWLKAIIKSYYPLLVNGRLVQAKILSPGMVVTIKLLWRFLPMYWYAIYQLLLLEIWLREYIYNENVKNIKTI